MSEHAPAPCLTDAQLASYVDRRLSQAEKNRADEHLARCPRCLQCVADVVKLLDEIDRTLP